MNVMVNRIDNFGQVMIKRPVLFLVLIPLRCFPKSSKRLIPFISILASLRITPFLLIIYLKCKVITANKISILPFHRDLRIVDRCLWQIHNLYCDRWRKWPVDILTGTTAVFYYYTLVHLLLREVTPDPEPTTHINLVHSNLKHMHKIEASTVNKKYHIGVTLQVFFMWITS